ncbi:MAG: hypothetical protein KGZ56_00920 [Dethiobacter sp.]|nr:hypothetical protein [Dethiobacter sp.]MBS3898694.1 hypothetical protein [Dethiobacter sp.]
MSRLGAVFMILMLLAMFCLTLYATSLMNMIYMERMQRLERDLNQIIQQQEIIKEQQYRLLQNNGGAGWVVYER